MQGIRSKWSSFSLILCSLTSGIQMDWVCWSVLQTAVTRSYFECVYSLFFLLLQLCLLMSFFWDFLSLASILSDSSRRLSYKNTLTWINCQSDFGSSGDFIIVIFKFVHSETALTVLVHLTLDPEGVIAKKRHLLVWQSLYSGDLTQTHRCSWVNRFVWTNRLSESSSDSLIKTVTCFN